MLYLIMEEVKPKRAYRSAQRSKQAELTRTAVLDAAEKLFRELGWASTTIAAIARQAQVSVETVYARFGNKRTIAHELITRAIRGDQQDVPLMQQDRRAHVLQQSDGNQILEAFASDISQLLLRVAPILAVIRTAAETDPTMAELYRELHHSRRRNLGRVVEALKEKGTLRSGLDGDSAIDMLWSIVSPELWQVRTEQLGLSPEANRGWISATLQRLLLP